MLPSPELPSTGDTFVFSALTPTVVNTDRNGKEQKTSPASGDLGTPSKPTPQTDVFAIFTSEEVTVLIVPM